ncbi:MAG: WS/DGAT domain-containing protein [Acidimicrobiia bacterium]|nr:WS/DGAT domain-containing protein [Acidimicrobiia bacterium]
MRQLTAREAALLRSETPTNLGHSSVYTVVDRSAAPDFDFEHLFDLVEQRLAAVPELRYRLREVPLRLDRPWWEHDDRFDPSFHIRHIGVPSSGRGDKEAALIARLHERPLNRERPLWELYLIDRPDGTAGIYVKVHHVLIEGITGLDLVTPLTAAESPDRGGMSTARPVLDEPMTDQQLLAEAAMSQLRSPVRWGRFGVSLVRNIPVIGPQILPSLAAQWAAPQGDVDVEAGELTAPRMPFNRALGASRKVSLTSLPVGALRDIRKRQGARFNDVVLAAVGGGLRRWLIDRAELPVDQLVALAPILVNSVDQPLGTALIGLATDTGDGLARLDSIRSQMDDLLATVEAHPVDTIRRLYQASPAVAAMASRLMARTGSASRFHPPFNVVVVSVPGETRQSDVLGAPVLHRFSLPALVDGTGLSICVLSQAESVDLCLIADRELIDDLDPLADAIRAAVLELDAL